MFLFVLIFLDDIVRQLDDDISHLVTFLGIAPTVDEIDIIHPYRLRFDVLLHRARLIVLEESSRMIVPLANTTNVSKHSVVMIEGMRKMTIREATERIEDLCNVVAECEARKLSRLEAEARLIQICFHFVVRDNGARSTLKVDDSMDKVLKLCQRFPDTAGALLNIYNAIREVLLGRRFRPNIYTPGARNVWWKQPKHETGNLLHCSNGHPYSGHNGKNCPECGREVPKIGTVKAKPVDPNTYLKEEEFMAAMRANCNTMNGKSWRN